MAPSVSERGFPVALHRGNINEQVTLFSWLTLEMTGSLVLLY